MVSEWKISVLEKVARVVDSLHQTPEFVSDGLPMVRAADVKSGFLELVGTKLVTRETFLEFTRNHKPRRGDIILSRVGSYFNFSYNKSDDAFCIGQNTSIIVPEIDSRYLYYSLLSPYVQGQIEQSLVGTSQKTLSLKHIRGLKISFPPPSEQSAIAHILGTLDDKIELNRRMNETLEALARTIFKSWFVDFDPVRDKAEGRQPAGMDAETATLFPDSFEDSPLDEIPRGWKITTIGEAVRVVGGSTPSTTEPIYWEDGSIHWATPKDLASLSDPVLLDTAKRITELGLKQISSGLLPPGAVLLSSRAPIGYLAISEVPVAINQGFIAMICDSELPNYYVLHWARINADSIVGRANGTTFLEISKTNFRPMSVLVPTKEVLHKYVEQVEPIHRKVVSNLRESRTLAALRDTLLPKLMSGEVRVKEAEKAVS